MAMFICGGSDLLNEKTVTARPTSDITYYASSDGYEGYESVKVSHFATLGPLTITSNGTRSVISGNNSYSSVNVNVIPAYSDLVLLRHFSPPLRGNTDNTVTISDMSNYRYIVCFGYIGFPTSGVDLSPAMGSTGYCNDAGSDWGNASFNIILPVQSSNDSTNLRWYRPVCAIAYFAGDGTNPSTGASMWVSGFRTGGTSISCGRTEVYFGNNRRTLFPDYSAIDTTWGYLTDIYGLK